MSQVNRLLQIRKKGEKIVGEMGIAGHTVMAVCSGLMRWLGNRVQQCLCEGVCVCVWCQTDVAASNKEAKEEPCMGVQCLAHISIGCVMRWQW